MGGMTKERLRAYQSNVAEIREIEETLSGLRESEAMIGNDVVFDYRGGYPRPQAVVGFDEGKYERTRERLIRRKEGLEREVEEVEAFVESIPDGLTRRIFRLYFIDGKSQNRVADAVHLDRSVISRKIDGHLKLAHKTHKTQL